MASFRNIKPEGGGTVVKPPQANAGLPAKYGEKIKALNAQMFRSVDYWISAAYRKRESEIVGDASPTAELQKKLDQLFKDWSKKYDVEAKEIADWFVNTANVSTTKALMSAIKKTVPTVKMQMSRKTENILKALTAENVALITNMPPLFFSKVEGSVMRAMQEGRDLATLKSEIKAAGVACDSRADLIARDQSNKATSVINRARQADLGITKAVWLHMRGGKEPRQSHIDANEKEFELSKGLLIDGEYIQPGEEINCGCVAAPIIPAFGKPS